MNFEIIFQLTALLFVIAAGPLVILLTFARNGKL